MNITQSKINKADRLQLFIEQARRNGYLQKIKQINRQSSGQANQYDIGYRKRATIHYSKKVVKPFKLEQQPQYKRQLRFNSDFKAFVRSIPEFQSIKQQPILSLPPMTDLQNQIHSQTLVYNPTQKCEISPQNIRKRKIKLQTDYHNYQDVSIFPTKINIKDHLKHDKIGRHQNQSRISIQLNSGARSNNQLSPYSPLKFIRTKTNKTNNSKNNKLTNRTLNLSKSRSGVTNSTHSLYINQTVALINLNRLVGTQSKQKNFRVPKQKLHQILCKKYGNDVIMNFFNLQIIQDFDGILKLVRQLASSSDILAQLLTFLTYDLNQDGVITEDQILKINDLINANSPIADDIKTIVTYANMNPQLKCQPDLPLQFVKFPTKKQFLKITQNIHDTQRQKVRGIYRLFSLKMQSQGAQADQIQRNQKIRQKKLKFINKKSIRINFQHFQRAFHGKGHPSFIKQVIQCLIGRDHHKLQQIHPSRKMSFSHDRKRLRRMTTATIDPRMFHTNLPNQDYQHHLSKAKELLHTLYHDKKQLSTIQFV